MQSQSHNFRSRSIAALADSRLQAALAKARGGFVDKRRAAIDALPEFEALRAQGQAIREHVLDHLDRYLDQYATKVEEIGGQVHWAETAADARRIIAELCAAAGAKRVTKGKSMVGEEVGLNEALEARGMEVVETDLGEYIIQLAKEPPSHIVAPAVHKNRAQVEALFRQHHRQEDIARDLSRIPDLVDEARRILREKFLSADVGITGANFLVAETGGNIIVTNEGNGDLTANLPKTHIVIAGIEKVVPTLDEAATLLRLLGRSATGQAITSYVTHHAGPRRPGDKDGPSAYHVVLVDNGRSRMLAGRYRDMLRCIRCGACMNHCPVYGALGGHAYGWVYPGPMGSVLTPLFLGLDKAKDLPNACTLNGRCQSVCPVGIPLPELLRDLREDQYRLGMMDKRWRWGLKLWAWGARRPSLYHAMARLKARLLARFARKRGYFRHLPTSRGWTDYRDLPAPQGDTFQSLWQKRKRS